MKGKVALMLAALSAVIAQPAGATQITRVVSKSGIEAWLVEDHTLPLISVELAFRGGSSQDPAGKPGVANMVASLLDEGAGPLDSEAFQQKLEDNAVELSFKATRDTLTGSLRTLAENGDLAFDLLRSALSEPRFDEEPVERIRAQVAARIRRDSKDGQTIASQAWFDAAFPGHAYGPATNGSEASIAAITREDIVGYKRRVLGRDNLVVAVVGAIDAKALAEKLDATFGALPAASELAPVANLEPQGAGTVKVIDLDVPQTNIIFGRPAILRDDPDFIPAYVLAHVLGGGTFSSRLFTEVREKRGLAYSVYAYLAPLDHAGLLLGGTATKNERAKEAIELIGSEVKRLLDKGVDEAELAKAKKYLTGSYALRFDTSTKIANQLVQIQLDRLGIDYLDRRNALIEAVTVDDLKRVANRILGDGKLLVVAVGRPAGLGEGAASAASGNKADASTVTVPAKGGSSGGDMR